MSFDLDAEEIEHAVLVGDAGILADALRAAYAAANAKKKLDALAVAKKNPYEAPAITTSMELDDAYAKASAEHRDKIVACAVALERSERAMDASDVERLDFDAFMPFAVARHIAGKDLREAVRAYIGLVTGASVDLPPKAPDDTIHVRWLDGKASK